MARSTLEKIKPLHPEKVPPYGAVPAGMTADGREQLWKLKRMRSRGVPDYEVDDDGEVKKDAAGNKIRKMRRHAITGEPMYGLNRPEVYEEELLFFLESEGNGNVRMVPYVPPTAEQLAAEARQERIAAMEKGLAAALVDANMTPEQLIAATRGLPMTSERSADAPAEPEAPAAEYPLNLKGGWWLLSNGQKIQAKEEQAKELEATAVAEQQRAHEHAEQTPEV